MIAHAFKQVLCSLYGEISRFYSISNFKFNLKNLKKSIIPV